MALDWIVPGTQQEDAPLSAAASRDALLRLVNEGYLVGTTRPDLSTFTRVDELGLGATGQSLAGAR